MFYMQIILDDYGMFLGKQGNRFIVTKKPKDDSETEIEKEFSADKVRQIIISTASSVSTDAVKLAMESNIDIVYTNYYGMPVARVYPCKLGGTTLTRRSQATQYNTEKAPKLVKAFVEAKVKNQAYLLKSLSKTREKVDFCQTADSMLNSLTKLESISGTVDEMREEILGIEGYAGNQYFACLTQILPFSQREHEAKDPVNAMLNYGYGILYSEIEKSCILAGLDPYLGFLHTDRYGKPSMVLDMIEEFRQPVVDRAIITLFALKKVEDSDFETSGNCFMLSKKGREKVIEAVMERLHTKITYKDKKASLQRIMLHQARMIAKFLLGEKSEYKPFIHKW